MAEITTSQDPANQKEYHRPKLRKFGNVSDLTFTFQTFVGSDGGSGINQYAS